VASGMTFAEMRSFEMENDLRYLGWADGAIQYLPKTVTRGAITDVAGSLTDPVNDTGLIRASVYELWLTTRHEKMTPEDRDAMLILYAKRLTGYPQGVVEVVLGMIVITSKWFPAWSEVQSEINVITGARVSLLTALRRFLAKAERTP
jgi:hypothetical protein